MRAAAGLGAVRSGAPWPRAVIECFSQSMLADATACARPGAITSASATPPDSKASFSSERSIFIGFSRGYRWGTRSAGVWGRRTMRVEHYTGPSVAAGKRRCL